LRRRDTVVYPKRNDVIPKRGKRLVHQKRSAIHLELALAQNLCYERRGVHGNPRVFRVLRRDALHHEFRSGQNVQSDAGSILFVYKKCSEKRKGRGKVSLVFSREGGREKKNATTQNPESLREKP